MGIHIWQERIFHEIPQLTVPEAFIRFTKISEILVLSLTFLSKQASCEYYIVNDVLLLKLALKL